MRRYRHRHQVPRVIDFGSEPRTPEANPGPRRMENRRGRDRCLECCKRTGGRLQRYRHHSPARTGACENRHATGSLPRLQCLSPARPARCRSGGFYADDEAGRRLPGPPAGRPHPAVDAFGDPDGVDLAPTEAGRLALRISPVLEQEDPRAVGIERAAARQPFDRAVRLDVRFQLDGPYGPATLGGIARVHLPRELLCPVARETLRDSRDGTIRGMDRWQVRSSEAYMSSGRAMPSRPLRARIPYLLSGAGSPA